MLQDECCEGRQKSAIFSKNDVVVHKLIIQQRYVTYHEIEASLGMNMTPKQLILHDHLAAATGSTAKYLLDSAIVRKMTFFDWYKEMLKKYDRGASKDTYKI